MNEIRGAATVWADKQPWSKSHALAYGSNGPGSPHRKPAAPSARAKTEAKLALLPRDTVAVLGRKRPFLAFSGLRWQ
jgi:hypothetical protein